MSQQQEEALLTSQDPLDSGDLDRFRTGTIGIEDYLDGRLNLSSKAPLDSSKEAQYSAISLNSLPDSAVGPESNSHVQQTPVGTQWSLQKALRPRRLSQWQGHRFGVALAAAVACSVLLTNILLVIIAVAKSSTTEGIATIYEGDCKVVTSWSTGLHVLINVLSSTLLAASNYTMQCLAAPTRQDIDRAHSKGKRLDIGTPSLHNMIRGFLPARRLSAWWLLCMSSLPIHFVFNSVLFKSTAVLKEVEVHIVSPGIFEDREPIHYNRWSQSLEWNCTSAGSALNKCWDDEDTDLCSNFTEYSRDLIGYQAWNNSASYFCLPPDTAYHLEPAPQARDTMWTCKTYSPWEADPDDLTETYNCSLGHDAHDKYRDIQSLTDSLTLPTLDNLTKPECLSAYARRFISDRGQLILVINDLHGKENIGYIGQRLDYSDDYGANPYDWMCPDECPNTALDGESTYACNFSCKTDDIETLQREVRASNNWTILTAAPGGNFGEWWEYDSGALLRDTFEIDYCLSPRVPQRCKLQLSFHLFAIVILCNLIKAATMVWTLFILKSTACYRQLTRCTGPIRALLIA
ncbi:hypothetical protein HII31_03517 [Pseudocercospora fuligena]|uniref:DUF6536 domain-containing protein n=1 Tax=Pseudocercospora fuligena TaxID=685502 RepID=A0A8H6RPZ5_9PEZI|nr:hypothetical protein HII31_03517 [Pseudocercospora fuligena]